MKRVCLVALAAALGVLHAQAPSPADRESAYRANNVGVAMLEQFDYERAAQTFRDALKIHPGLEMARLNLAIALFYGGKPTEAAAEAKVAAERLPQSPQAQYVLGLIARAQDDLVTATSALERAVELDPVDAGAKVNLGQIALQQRQFDRALPLFREALTAEPFNVTAAYSVALALIRSGQQEEGRKAMQAFEALRDSAYGVTYAQAYLSQGKLAEAIASTGEEAELVETATPPVTFADATSTMLPAAGPASGAQGGGLTLFDADGDGDLDLVEAGGSTQRFFRNEKGVFSNDTARAGLAAGGGGIRLGAVAGDLDNDGRPEVLVLRTGGPFLLRQKTDAVFEDVTATAGIKAADATAAALADVDHDGDLDIVLPGSPTHLFRNNGNGTFADIAVQAGVSAPVRAVAVVATDYDNRRDIDLLIAASSGSPILYRNLRDGSFRNAAAETGLPGEGSYSAVAAGDVNKDGFTDLFLGKRDQPGVLAVSDGQARFRTAAAPDESRGAVAAQFVDYDNDGLLDLLTIAEAGARLFRNVGGGKWSDVTAAARLGALASGKTVVQSLALGDLDGDGDTDAVVRLADGDLRAWRNDGGNRSASLRVRLASRVSNRSAVGTKVEIRAGSLRQQFETSSSSPAARPADVSFGLGARAAADVVRALWPSGILQAETDLKGDGATANRSTVLTLTELDRKPSSCPYLFTWNGSRFEFVTDFMGGSEMGAWLAPGTWNTPDPDEYVRVTRHQLRPRNGRYELRVTNELEEALFVDRLQLVSVDHVEGTDVFPNEGLTSPPRPPLSIVATRGARPPFRAVDEHGHDVLPLISALDRRYPDDFRLLPVRGYAEPHWLTLDLSESRAPNAEQRLRPERGAQPPSERARGWGPARTDNADAVLLLLTGWTDYAFSNDNVAASQSGAEMLPPSLQVKDPSGAWRTVIDEIGFPVGRPQTIAVNLQGKWLSSSREVRIVTSMRVYWDRILVDRSGGGFETRVTRLDPVVADLRWRGFSAEDSPDRREPFGYDYSRVSTTNPWKVMIGRYTREGDVRPLLREVDDMYVISQPGDELALAFDEDALPALPEGWTRTFLVYAHGWSKEMNPRSATPDAVWPLPFFKMSRYPYGPEESYPHTRLLREYHEKYNTRIVPRTIASIDARLLGDEQFTTPKTQPPTSKRH